MGSETSPDWIKNYQQLAEHNDRFFSKYDGNQEIQFVFDRYDNYTIISETRTRRQVSGDPVYYRITDSTHILKEPLKNLLSHKRR